MISTYASGIQTGTIGIENFLSSPNAQGKFLLHVDLSNMAALDYTEIRRYKMALSGGTSRVIDVQTFQGAQPTDLLIFESDEVWNSFTDTNAVRFSLKQTLGTARAYSWSVLLEDSLAPTVSGRTLGVAADGTVGLTTGTFIDSIADQVWNETLADHQAVGSTGKALNSASTGGDPWATSLPGAYVPGQAGYILASRMPTGTVIVGQNNDKTGYFLGTPQVFDLIGNITGTFVGNISGAVGQLQVNLDKTGYGLLNNQIVNFSGTITNVMNVINPVTVGANNDKLGYSLSSPQSVDITGNISGTITNVLNVVNPVGIVTGSFINAIADGVWDEQIAGHLSAGSTGEKLNSASSGGDPWGTALPGAYIPGQAGYILASRMPTGTVIVGTNQDKTGYSLASPQTVNIIGNISGTFVGNIQGNVTGSVGEVLTIAGALCNKIADHVLRRTYANARVSADGDAVSFRSLLGAIGKLVNRWNIVGTTLTVYQEDDATATAPGGTQALTGTPGADPITQIDTN